MRVGEPKNFAILSSYNRTVFFSVQQKIEYGNIKSLCDFA
jgi:hypothetical protein